MRALLRAVRLWRAFTALALHHKRAKWRARRRAGRRLRQRAWTAWRLAMVQRREHELTAAAVLAGRRPKIVAAMFATWLLSLNNLHEWRWQMSRASLRHRLHRWDPGSFISFRAS